MKSSLLPVFYMHTKQQNEKNINQRLHNISLQKMFKVPASGPNTRPQPGTPLINRIVSDRLLHATPRFPVLPDSRSFFGK